LYFQNDPAGPATPSLDEEAPTNQASLPGGGDDNGIVFDATDVTTRAAANKNANSMYGDLYISAPHG
jgi:hypothetical protein